LFLFFLLPGWIAQPSPAAGGALWEEFSGEKAWEHVKRLVDFGPRPSGSEALEKSREYIEKELRGLGWEVTRQTFTDDTPRGKVTFSNLIAQFPSRAKSAAIPVFLLCSHYDTKWFETVRFVGANDSGSSTGLLLELGRLLAGHPNLAKKVQLVFFDGEEAYENFSDTDGLFGSRYFARKLAETPAVKNFRGGLLFDMVGDQSLDITLSPDSPSNMARDIFAAAEALKVRKHFTYFHSPILDDHTPLNRIGIPTLDLIDFNYPAWHTGDDTIDKVSAESLRIVGSVAVYYLAEFALK
jgi:hypothetical protein